VIAISYRYWLPLVARYLIVNDQLHDSDVIIVPSGNCQNLRIDHAVKVLEKRYASKVLLCGRLALQKETSLNLAKIYITKLGVPESDILLEEESQSTFENALFSKRIIQEKAYKSVIIVTYPIHTRRTKMIFKKTLPKEIKVMACCNKEDFNTINWWRDRNAAREVAYEYFAFIWYALFGC
jgi:uncharacterized SAM-binding protein YcdF (DUF218 family)